MGPLRRRRVCVRVLMLRALLLARALVSARVGLPLLVMVSVRGIATRRVSVLMVCCSSVTVRDGECVSLMVMVLAVVGVVRLQVLLALVVAAMTMVAVMAAVVEAEAAVVLSRES